MLHQQLENGSIVKQFDEKHDEPLFIGSLKCIPAALLPYSLSRQLTEKCP